METRPLRLEENMMISPPSFPDDTPRRRVMRLRGTSLVVADALAETELRFTLVPQPSRKLLLVA